MSEEASRKRKADEASCPYLDTIERTLLDFDLEPICSVSLEKGPHLYACLVCGKYFRGKGSQTPAYTHSVEDSHYVFIHLGSSEIFCLPDNYQVHDASLDDIKDALSPSYAKQQVQVIDQQSELSRDLFGRRYLPGFVGLNDLHNGINAVVQALSHVPSLRDYFLLHPVLPECTKDSAKAAHHVAVAFGELVRQIWSRHRIKGTVDPHRLVQAIVAASGKRFQMGVQVEVGELLTWLLHQLHVGTGGTHKKGSIVQRTFQGKVRVTTRQAKAVEKKQIGQEDDRLGSDDEAGPLPDVTMEDEKVEIEETVSDTQFMQLALDIPEKPLFRDEDGGLVIPQEPYSNLLKKFDGITFSDAISRSGTAQRKRYQILKLPNYLILHLSRFSTNQYSREKNPTIVAFPVKNFDLGSYVHREEKIELPTPDAVRSMGVKEIKKLLTKHGRQDIAENVIEKNELVEVAVDFVATSLPKLLADKYDLVANIAHESPSEVGREGKHDPLQEGSYKCHVQHLGTKQWYEMQDLHVQEIMPQQIGLSECSILIFRRSSS